MTWLKVDDKLHAHPKTTRAGLPAMGLWVVSGSWVASYELDGRVSSEFVRNQPRGARLARDLVDAGLWTPDADGWVFHDWAKFQPTHADLEAERARNAERQRVYRLSRRDAQRDNGPTNNAPTRPDPTRPETQTHNPPTPL